MTTTLSDSCPKKMNYKPIQLFNLLKNCEKLPASKNVLPCDTQEKIDHQSGRKGYC